MGSPGDSVDTPVSYADDGGDSNLEKNFWRADPWTWRELAALLLLEFGVVIFGIKGSLASVYEQWLGDPLYAGALTGLTIALVLTGGIYLIALRWGRLAWQEVGLDGLPPVSWRRILLWALIALAGSAAAMILASFFGNSFTNTKTDALQQAVGPGAWAVAFVSAVIVSPVYEEIFYRGFVYRWLRTRTGCGWAIVLSALIHTVSHWPTTSVFPLAVVTGFVLAWAYEQTRSIWPAIIVHGLVNLTALVLTALG